MKLNNAWYPHARAGRLRGHFLALCMALLSFPAVAEWYWASEIFGDCHRLIAFDDALLVFAYDPAELGETGVLRRSTDGLTWAQVSDENFPGLNRSGYEVVVFDGKLWMLHQDGVWNSVDGVIWTQVTDSVPWVRNSSVCAYDCHLWLVTPGYGTGFGDGYAYADSAPVYKSMDGVTWTLLTDTPEWSIQGFQVRGRGQPWLFVHAGKLWLAGGSISLEEDWGDENDLWYTSDGITWTEPSERYPWSYRTLFFPVDFEGSICVMGGKMLGSNTAFHDVWQTVDGVNWVQGPEDELPWEAWPIRGPVVYNGAVWLIAPAKLHDNSYHLWYSPNPGTNPGEGEGEGEPPVTGCAAGSQTGHSRGNAMDMLAVLLAAGCLLVKRHAVQ